MRYSLLSGLVPARSFHASSRRRKQARQFQPGQTQASWRLEPRTLLATLPPGFTQTLVADKLAAPTSMEFAPDGRIFLTEKNGNLRVIKDGTLLEQPFLTLPVDSRGERGLLGVAFDPSFEANQYVYVFYTTAEDPRNRISRFVANGDVALPGSEQILLELDPLRLDPPYIHNGGAMEFGLDGKLYIGVGDNAAPASPAVPQRLDRFAGKILRINPDGSIPEDNPFYNTATGSFRAIWAMGVRNPFTFSVQPGTGLIYINDVGSNIAEEINLGTPGANYGWPGYEGAVSQAGYQDPIYSYPHDYRPGGACAITGGVFYNPASASFPPEFHGKYFFVDYCGQWIKTYDPHHEHGDHHEGEHEHSQVQDFASGLDSLPIDLEVDAQGNLYYLGWVDRSADLYSGTGLIHRIAFLPDSPPVGDPLPQVERIIAGQNLTLQVAPYGQPPFTYQWQRDEVDIPGANAPSLVIPAIGLADQGAQFRVLVTNPKGTTTSTITTLNVIPGQAPTPVITSPALGSLYSPGQIITYSGLATDTEDGTLPTSALTWRVDFHHDFHFHPYVPTTTGVSGGSFEITTAAHDPGVYWYRIHLTATDSTGLATSTFVDIHPFQPGPVTGNLAPNSDRGTSRTDNITNQNRPAFQGAAPLNTTVFLFARRVGTDQQLALGSVRVNNRGRWNLNTRRSLPDGIYNILAATGTRQGPNTPLHPLWGPIAGPLVIDTRGPRIVEQSYNPTAGVVDLVFRDDQSGLELGRLAFPGSYQLGRFRSTRGIVPILVSAPSAQPGVPARVQVAIADRLRTERRPTNFIVRASSITDIAGNALDGESNRVFPTGNGRPGGDFRFRIT